MKRGLPKLIERLENAPHHWGYSVATFLGIVLARNLLEGALGPKGALGFTYFASPSALMVLDHFTLFYVTLFLGFALVISLLARQPVGRVMKVMTPAWTLILIPPFLDYLLSSGEGVRIAYVADLGRVVLRFFDPRASLDAISTGQRVEIIAACFLAATYVRVKTRDWLRTIGAFVGVYLLLALVAFIPSAFARASWTLTEGGPASQPLTYDVTYKSGGLVPDESRKLALLFLLSSSVLGWLAYVRHAPAKARAMIRSLRPLRSTHYVGLALFGAALGLAIFVPAGVHVGTGGDVLGIVGIVLAVFFAFQSSAAVNDVFDVEGDRVAGNRRPLAEGTLTRGDVVTHSLVLAVLAFLFALNVKYSTFLALLLAYAVSLLYSMPPLRLKSLPVVSTLSLGAVSLLTCLAGFSLLAEERAFALFPPRLAWLVFLSFGLGFAAKDLKDVEGDRATGVVTLPILLGEGAGKIAIAFSVFAGYALVPILLPFRALVAPSLALGAWSAAMVFLWKRRGLDKLLLAVCLAFTLAVAIVSILNVGDVARVDPQLVSGKAGEFVGRRATAFRDWTSAALGYGLAATASPHDASLHEMAGIAYFEAGDDDEARRLLKRAIALDPSAPVAREYLAAARGRAGDAELARRGMLGAVERGLRPRVFLSLVGESHMRDGRPLFAAEAFVNALALGQPDVPVRLRLADAYVGMREYAHAGRELHRVVERHPSSPQAHDAMGKFLNSRGEHRDAAAAFLRAVELEPDEPVFWNNLGVARRLAGEYDGALAALANASRLAPRMIDPYYNRGEIARALGHHEEARRQFLLALEIDPTFVPARVALEGAAENQHRTKTPALHSGRD